MIIKGKGNTIRIPIKWKESWIWEGIIESSPKHFSIKVPIRQNNLIKLTYLVVFKGEKFSHWVQGRIPPARCNVEKRNMLKLFKKGVFNG